MKQNIIRTVLSLCCLALLINAPRAQHANAPVTTKESNADRIALHQALLDLTNPWTVMCIAAHPDDEDGTSLIVMRRKYGAHTVSLFTTFGEGGQNAIGPELYEELGAIRARETMAASEIQGSEPHFLGLKDFGYSKSADEAFRFWGHDESLRRMVLQIRKLRPDVIITNHDTSRGHGHHQATGQLVLEAFDAAADPKRFPEQLKEGVQPWQVQRLFVRGFGSAPQQPAGQKPDREGGLATIDPNERDPIRGKSFAEQALEALQKHATQGPWPKTISDMARFRNSPDGKLPLIRYRLVREARVPKALPKESHNFLDGLRLPDSLTNVFRLPTIEGRQLLDFADQPDRVLTALMESEKMARLVGPVDVGDYFRFAALTKHFQRALVVASGLSVRLTPDHGQAAPTNQLKLTFELSNHGTREIRINNLRFGAGDPERRVTLRPVATLNAVLAPGKTFSRPITYQIPTNSEVTVPHQMHLYDGRFRGYPLGANAVVETDNFPFEAPAQTTVDVAPAGEIANISPSPVIVTQKTAEQPQTFLIRVANNQTERATARILLTTRTNGLEHLDVGPEFLLQPGQSREISISTASLVMLKPQPSARGTFTFSLSRRNTKLAERTVPFTYADARIAPNVRVGYLRGFDNSLPAALTALGAESKELRIADVRTGDLQKYTTIIVDNRVYESQPELIATNQRLLDYAKDGGTLIVFYHKSNEWNPNQRVNRPQLAPYPIILNDERITDENAPVTFIEPQHPLLNVPNKMGQEDFKDWIQERGLYYPKEWDAQYHALLAANDPGEQPLRGGLLVADYGQGHYIYTSMVWYRQLRAGVPGAYRMLANMISYGKTAP